MRYKRSNESKRLHFKNYCSALFYDIKTTVIALNYVYTGGNFVVAGLHSINLEDPVLNRVLTFTGVTFLLMVPVVVLDDRKDMHSLFVVLGTCAMHFALSVMLAFDYSFWWVVVYISEVLLSLCIIIILKKLKT